MNLLTKLLDINKYCGPTEALYVNKSNSLVFTLRVDSQEENRFKLPQNDWTLMYDMAP